MPLTDAEVLRRARAGYERNAVLRNWTDDAGHPMLGWNSLTEGQRNLWRQIALAVLEVEGA